MNIKKINNNIIICTGMTILLIVSIFSNMHIFENNLIEMSTFIVIALICIIRMSFFEKNTYSLDSFHFLFIFLFTVIAPLYQIGSGEFPWELSISGQPIYKANVLIIVWLLVYITIYKKVYDSSKITNVDRKNTTVSNSKNVNLVLVLISLGALIILIKEYGFVNLFSRSLSNSVMVDNLKSTGLIISVFVRSIPIAVFALLVCKMKIKGHKNYTSTVFSFILLVVSNFPTGTARYWMGVVYLGCAILILKDIFVEYRLIEIIGIFGILIIFPVVNIFRYITLSEFKFSDLNFEGVKEMTIFLSGDFDAYSMFLRTIRVVDMYGSVYFNELIGSIFFFVPRSIWEGKPEGSGPYVATLEGLSYTNLSEPIFAEGYLNFDLMGLLLFAVGIGILLAYIDKKYWKCINSKVLNITTMFYPFLLGNIFTNFRGSLLSTLAYTIGQLFAFIIIYFIYIKISKIKFVYRN